MNPACNTRIDPTRSASVAFDGVDLDALAAHFGTPLQVYSAGAIRQRIHALHCELIGLDAMVCYAVKANSNHAVLRLMAEAGLGADIVSSGELRRCLRAGIAAQRIVFSGVGKSEAEIIEALEAGVCRFNVESFDELCLLRQLADQRATTTHAAVRINPDVDAQTHAKISTGKAENKFGVGLDEARRWFAQHPRTSRLRLDGLHVHIGSQILNLDPFRVALERTAALQRELAGQGHLITSLDVGGGLGVRYREDEDRAIDIADYVDVVRRSLHDFRGRLVFEPGRWLVAEAGLLLTRIIRIKHGQQRRFVVVDAAMNDLLRPSLYDAWHEIAAVSDTPAQRMICDVVGPVCETGDTFARARELPECAAGDLLMIRTTGAYAASMASNYNSRPLAAEVMVDDGRYAAIRQRQSFEQMTAGEVMTPQWQSL
ncbi:diaminopimelate decarboxylase [Dokdonella sp.]|uniref:diaminopimelate decarboxylase n=1 Tax=Dokdonella sp. TaxID=2291710 RepID=UPI002BA5BB9A|nr:diaminopimelate decarboxylase [Dokdonella sp.]HOX73014.1 diaminopimelate decarboxylase [Dokdonella sp.]HPN80019.1 diaminopimelate decarboxylase [Dokdonella sp.]